MHKVTVRIPLDCGNSLEGRLCFQQEDATGTGVVICPPHPLLAGNMDNNVVRAVADRLARDRPVLLFNYQAVGESYKPRQLPLFEHWQQLDKDNDFSAVIRETAQVLGHSRKYFARCHLVGYSFGAFIAHNCIDGQTASYTAIAPPVTEHRFSPTQAKLPTLVVRGGRDNLLGHGPDTCFPECRIVDIDEADHFFIGHEQEVGEGVARFIERLYSLEE